MVSQLQIFHLESWMENNNCIIYIYFRCMYNFLVDHYHFLLNFLLLSISSHKLNVHLAALPVHRSTGSVIYVSEVSDRALVSS